MFYLHIPKTGGQTLGRRLASAFPSGRAWLREEDFVYPDDAETLRRALAGYDFVESHVSGELLGEVAVQDLLVTVREPVAQIVSNYRHVRRESERRLSRAARELSPAEFFDHFGDFFADHQARYLLSAFVPLEILAEREGWWPSVTACLPEVLEQIRWLVPTERIDTFMPLWEAETGRLAAEHRITINRAPPDDVDLAELEKVIRARPWLFALDNLLYQLAQARFTAWSEGIRAQLTPWSYPENASRVFTGEGSGVWLRRGWYPAEETPLGQGNWAGPARRSDLEVLRRPGQDRLEFDVLVVNGITQDEITAFASDGYRPLVVWRDQIEPERCRYSIDLSSLPAAASVALAVPNCYAPINVFPEGEDAELERRSFLAAGWALVGAPVEDAAAVVEAVSGE